MNFAKTLLKVKNVAKSTPIGRKIRDKHLMPSTSRESALKAIDKMVGADLFENKEKIVDDMINESKDYGFSFGEYLMFQFYKLSHKERREFISTRDRINYCERLNKYRNMHIFDDKAETYKVYKKYYKRDLISVCKNDNRTRNEFEKFIEKHPRFIVKPFDGAGGVGIRILDSKDSDSKNISKLLEEYKRGFVAEELIIQCDEMASFHPQSLNTLRIFTIRFDDRTEVICPIFRVGVGDSCVDNASAGGIAFGVDATTGELTLGMDKAGKYYTKHPDTGKEFVGYKIPQWKEAVELAKELAEIIPDNRFTGWDFALTDEGWVMQEANDRGDISFAQCIEKKGLRREMEAIVREIGA